MLRRIVILLTLALAACNLSVPEVTPTLAPTRTPSPIPLSTNTPLPTNTPTTVPINYQAPATDRPGFNDRARRGSIRPEFEPC